jgi:hypothetical protein
MGIMNLELTPNSTMNLLKIFMSGFVFCIVGLVMAIIIKSEIGIFLFLGMFGVVLILSIISNKKVQQIRK